MEFKINPSGDEVKAAGYESHAAYHRARKRQAKLDQWQARNDDNSTAPSERASRLPAHLDNPYPGSMSQRALRPAQSEEQASKPSLIPALNPAEFHDAKNAFEWFHYPHTLSDDRKKWALRFGVALRLCTGQETWAGLDTTRKSLVLRFINSEDAKLKFS